MKHQYTDTFNVNKTNKKVVVIGGGTGTFTVLTGLKKCSVELSAIVSMADNGGSTGMLRDELGVLPPGDIRQCLVALSESPQVLRELFMYRFGSGSLRGHNFGNLFLSALEKVIGNPQEAIREAGKILSIRGKVIPVTVEDMNLYAELENGKIISGETTIDEPRSTGHLKINRIFLKPTVRASFEAVASIEEADVLILGPGDLYTSILPNLLVYGIPEAIRRSRARCVYVSNIMTKFGQTNGFKASDFVREVEFYLGRKMINRVIVNTAVLPTKCLDFYAKEKEYVVKADTALIKKMGYAVIQGNFVNRNMLKKNKADKLKRSLIRHDPDKLAKAILSIIP